MSSLEDLKHVACQTIDNLSGDLHKVSQAIWEKPELAYEEHSAHDILCDFLEKQGFAVERQFVVDTAFRAVHGDGDGPHVAVLAEYDALPDIGHACGHNLIAEVGVGAGVAIKAAMQAAGKPLGKLTVFGSPAEEGRGAKIKLIMAGHFADVDYSLMAHPFPATYTGLTVFGSPAEEGGGGKVRFVQAGKFSDLDYAVMAHPSPVSWTWPNISARDTVSVTYHGRASHAAGFPWEGLNALDAVVMAYNNVSCMRQQMKPTWRVHGIITNGGAKPNIIPEKAAMQYYVRAPTVAELEVLKVRIVRCFEAAATATGCKVDIYWEPNGYANMITNKTLASLYDANATALGIEMCSDEVLARQATGSTDMGNVSHEVPSIHPMFYIGSKAMNHTRDFTTAAGADVAQMYTLDQAKALAMTALDALHNPDLVKQMKKEFEKDLKDEAGSA